MLRSPLAIRLPLFLFFLLFFIATSRDSVFAQVRAGDGQSYPAQASTSRPATAKTYALEMVNTQYDPESSIARFDLVNHGHRDITAYSVMFSVIRDGEEISGSGKSEDLVNTEVFAQCEVSAASATGGASDDSLKGTIKPGESRSESLSVGVDRNKLNGATPEIRGRVTAIIWADGRIEGNETGPQGISDMKRMLDMRGEESAEEAKVLAILNAHADETDIHRRIEEAINDLQALIDEQDPAKNANPPAAIPTVENKAHGTGGCKRSCQLEEPGTVSISA
jgi:hypothetical protein